MSNLLQPGHNDLAVFFLAQGEQSGEIIAQRLADFIGGAEKSLDMALFDFRLSAPLRDIIAPVLQQKAEAGVSIRIAYDADKPTIPSLVEGADPAPSGTGQFVQSLGYPWRRIGGLKLMHHKYIVRDAGLPNATIWTGSTNLTDDSWNLQENNILEIASLELAEYYAQDFAALWQTGQIGNSGAFDTRSVTLVYQGKPAKVRLLFSPGRGPAIDYEVARRVAQAEKQVRICSMLLNSGALLAALSDLLRLERVSVGGIYDRTQMSGVLEQWQAIPPNRWKIEAINNIVETARLVGKNSTPYSPNTRHDFMHNKVLIVDDLVITGSYNFSHSATLNAENILMIESPALAAEYKAYVSHLMSKYRETSPLPLS